VVVVRDKTGLMASTQHHINRSLTKWLLGGAISPFMVAAFVFLSQSSLSNPFHNI
jgi:hypothetical protein